MYPVMIMPTACVITIGVFDAVHQGHRAILATARHLADQARVPLVVLAFDPHPAAVLRPESLPPRLSSPQEKQALLKTAGADRVVFLKPSPELFSKSPQMFIQQLVQSYHPIAFVEGSNFRFGHQRAGDIDTLRDLGRQHGFDVHVQAQTQVMLSDQMFPPVSSTLTRWLVGHGRMADAARCLGRRYSLTGLVIHGEARGRTIQVPTINLDLSGQSDKLIPADGVYAGLAFLPDGPSRAAAISIGVKPTFGQHRLTLEAHLLDFSGDLYGRKVTLQFSRWLRDQQPFPDIESLKAQLQRDIAQTRRWHDSGILEEIHQTQNV